MNQPSPVRFDDPDACVEATLSRVGKQIVLGLPVAIGKPNPLVNAFVKRAVSDPSLRLTIVTALSLRKPQWHSDLERRLVQPLARRVFGDYPELEYVRLIEQQRLPDNIEVIEFFLEPGAWLDNEHLQQHYLSANYTHVARDAMRRGLNVIAQIVAPPPPGEASPGLLSLGSNPDLTADLLPEIAAMRDRGRPFALIGQMHRELPFMYGDALIAADTFDFIVDTTPYPLFCPPNRPIPLTQHAIALNVSALIRDGGTLQVGIGELGDGIVYAMQLRHRRPAVYPEILQSTGILDRHRRLIESEGGTAPFERGLYGCTEMLADGFLDLYRSGILKRRVYPNARLQRLLDDGHIDERVSLQTLETLCADGMRRMSFADFDEFRDAGVFRDEVQYDRGMLISPDGVHIPVNFHDPASRAEIAKTCLGERLRNGVLVDAGFFFGPKGFYAGLRQLTAEERRLFAMRGIGFVNELYGHEWELKVAQRRYARFINTTMMVTGLGAAVIGCTCRWPRRERGRRSVQLRCDGACAARSTLDSVSACDSHCKRRYHLEYYVEFWEHDNSTSSSRHHRDGIRHRGFTRQDRPRSRGSADNDHGRAFSGSVHRRRHTFSQIAGRLSPDSDGPEQYAAQASARVRRVARAGTVHGIAVWQ